LTNHRTGDNKHDHHDDDNHDERGGERQRGRRCSPG